MGNNMEKQEQTEAKKVYIEFNKAFVQTRKNVVGDEFFSITLPKGTVIGEEDMGGWSFTQSKMYPSKYREGYLVASFPNEGWQVPLNRSVKTEEGEWKTEYRRVNAAAVAGACKAAKDAWAKEHGRKAQAKEAFIPLGKVAPGPRGLEEILEQAYPKASFGKGEEGQALLQATRAENLANEALLKIWAEGCAARLVELMPEVFSPERKYDEESIERDLIGGNDGKYSRTLVALLLDDLKEEHIVMAAKLADSLDELHTIREATLTVQANRRLADAMERRYGKDIAPEKAEKVAKVAEQARVSINQVTAADIGEWAGIAVPVEFAPPRPTREEKVRQTAERR